MLDYIIVGNGLAGTLLSYKLIKDGRSLLIVDEDREMSAWKVAGGVWNAITFRKILKAWEADAFVNEADDFYKQLEVELDEKFYQEKKIVRIFADQHFQNSWYAKSAEDSFSDYLEDEYPAEIDQLPIDKEFGAGTVNRGGYVDLMHLIPRLREENRKKAEQVHEHFDHDALLIHEDAVEYKGQKASGIIFCEGYEMLNNPHFSWLPLKPTKGETLVLKNPGWKFSSIINNGKHLIDHGDGTMGVGATFDWKNLDQNNTPEAKKSLLDHLEKNFRFKDWEVLQQKAGVRPTVSDRRPLLGTHPDKPRLHIFNGLGTKGVMLAPLLTKWMLAHLHEEQALPKECSIDRFVKKHYR